MTPEELIEILEEKPDITHIFEIINKVGIGNTMPEAFQDSLRNHIMEIFFDKNKNVYIVEKEGKKLVLTREQLLRLPALYYFNPKDLKYLGIKLMSL